MGFETGPAIGAGILGGGIMSMMLYMGIAMMPRQMIMNLFLMLGTMMVRDTKMAYVAGAMMHAVMSIGFGLLHVAFYNAFDLESALVAWGIIFGLVHWVITGMMLGMMPVMHPLMRTGRVDAPGAFALGYPRATAMGFLMLHVVFGILVGAFYTAFT